MFHHTHNVTVVSKLHQRQIEKEKGVNHFISVSLDSFDHPKESRCSFKLTPCHFYGL